MTGGLPGREAGEGVMPEHSSPTSRRSGSVKVSIVIPCLNEEASIGAVIEKAQQALQGLAVEGEIIVADNGSTDRSVEIAQSLGARVIHVPARGYGNALRAGINAAQGDYIVIGDADDSYDFREVPNLLKPLREGYDLVLGSRFRGNILPGAMRWSSRIGNPLVTALLNLLFGMNISDSQTGMRAFTREAWRRLNPQASGMEFASEMLIQAREAGLRITEVPITFYPDRRNRPPHLRPLRDGWRHLKFMLIYAPTFLFLVPGGAMILFGGLLMGAQFLAPMTQPLWIGPVRLDFHWALLGSLLTLSGYTLVEAHFLAKIYAFTHWYRKRDPLLEKGFRLLNAERSVCLSLCLLFAGLGMDGWVLYDWIAHGYGELVSGHTRIVIFGSTLIVLGIQTFFHTFLFSLLGHGYKHRPLDPPT